MQDKSTPDAPAPGPAPPRARRSCRHARAGQARHPRRGGETRQRLGHRHDHRPGGEHRRVPADRPDEPRPEVRRLPAEHQRQRRGPQRRGCGGIHTGGAGDRRHIPPQLRPLGSPGPGSGVPTWEVGYLTPKESFIGLVQTRQANPTWLLQQTKNAPVTGNRNAGGQEWELRDTGKGEKSMVLEPPRHHRHPDRDGATGRVRGPGRRRREVPGQ